MNGVEKRVIYTAHQIGVAAKSANDNATVLRPLSIAPMTFEGRIFFKGCRRYVADHMVVQHLEQEGELRPELVYD